jgi:hypothetical protein
MLASGFKKKLNGIRSFWLKMRAPSFKTSFSSTFNLIFFNLLITYHADCVLSKGTLFKDHG